MAPARKALPRVVKIDASHVADFEALHCDANGAGWCRCVAWWTPTWEGWNDRSAQQNAELRRELFADGENDGYLAYLGDEPAGWCQVGPRDRLEKLVKQFDLHRDPSAWAVTCFFVAPAHRRVGLASFLLEEVLEDLRRHGVTRVEAFPRMSAKDAGDCWTGPREMYERAGFVEVKAVAHSFVMAWEPKA